MVNFMYSYIKKKISVEYLAILIMNLQIYFKLFTIELLFCFKVQDIARQTRGVCTCSEPSCSRSHIKKLSDGKYDVYGKSVYVRVRKLIFLFFEGLYFQKNRNSNVFKCLVYTAKTFHHSKQKKKTYFIHILLSVLHSKNFCW